MREYKGGLRIIAPDSTDENQLKARLVEFASALVDDPRGREYTILPGGTVTTTLERVGKRPPRPMTGFTVYNDRSARFRVKVVPSFLPGTSEIIRLGEVHQLMSEILFNNDAMGETVGRTYNGMVHVVNAAPVPYIVMQATNREDASAGEDLLEFCQENILFEDVEWEPQPGRTSITEQDMMRLGYELAGTIKHELRKIKGYNVADDKTAGWERKLWYAMSIGQVTSWEHLGEYCDPNCLGDSEFMFSYINVISTHNWARVDSNELTEDEALVQTRCDVINIAQQEVDKWLRWGGLNL